MIVKLSFQLVIISQFIVGEGVVCRQNPKPVCSPKKMGEKSSVSSQAHAGRCKDGKRPNRDLIFQVAKLQPLAGEIADESIGLWIGHTTNFLPNLTSAFPRQPSAKERPAWNSKENKTICSQGKIIAGYGLEKSFFCVLVSSEKKRETKPPEHKPKRIKIFRLGLLRCLEKIETGNFRFGQTYAIDPRQKLAEDGMNFLQGEIFVPHARIGFSAMNAICGEQVPGDKEILRTNKFGLFFWDPCFEDRKTFRKEARISNADAFSRTCSNR